MTAKHPTGFKPAYLRECLDVLSADPPVIRWRFRPLAHFHGERAERYFKAWGKSYAGQLIRSGLDGRFRLSLDGRTISGVTVIEEIGVTPIGDRQGMPDGMTDDRLAGTRDVAGTGPLAAVVREAMAETGRPLADLMVMSAERDPYRMDTPAKHRDAQWFAAQVARFIAPERRIHIRGVFYACVSAAALTLPDGAPFKNNEDTEAFLGDAAQYARWLGYIDFERLIDNKNDKPIVREAPENKQPSGFAWSGEIDIAELDPNDLNVFPGLTDFKPRQPYRLVFFGEKTSLDDVLAPLAEEVSADLYLMSGQISDTYLHQIARDAAADGRPLVVFTFSDFDPAGYWDMPVAISRKLQALKDLLFPTLEFTVVHAALGPEQVRELELPSSPMKSGEGRAAKWLELYGSEQTEIDALATLRPEVLERIAREAVAPYFDAGLKARVEAAEAAWREAAAVQITRQVDDDALDALRERAQSALDELQAVNDAVGALAAEIEVSDAPDLPEADMEALKEAQAERRDTVLIDSDMDYVEATDRLNEHNEKAARRKPKPARRQHVRRAGSVAE